jgi:regulator of sigma E protease
LITYARKTYLIPLAYGEMPKALAETKSQLDAPQTQLSEGLATMSLSLEGQNASSAAPVIVDTPNGKALKETTNFTIRPWPIGGFVRIKGMMPEDDGSEIQVPGGFYSKAPWKRFIVLLAGPAFSVLAGVILIFGLLAFVGLPKPSTVPILGTITTGSPAEAAGLKQGDRIISINGDSIPTFYQVITHVRSAGGQHLAVVYSRDGQQHTADLVPETDASATPLMGPDLNLTTNVAIQAKMGAYPSMLFDRMSVGPALAESFSMPGKAVVMLARLLAKPAQLKNAVGGPISMLKDTREAVHSGFADIVNLAAMLSISVGIFNLLPIVPLDGGQMAIAVAEMFRRGRRLSMSVQNTVAAAGMFLVLSLVVVVMFIDIQRLGGPDPNDFKTIHSAGKTAPKK